MHEKTCATQRVVLDRISTLWPSTLVGKFPSRLGKFSKRLKVQEKNMMTLLLKILAPKFILALLSLRLTLFHFDPNDFT